MKASAAKPAPVRVTVSMPKDLHDSIQSARGLLLHKWAAELSYSGAVDMLVRAGIIYLAQSTIDLSDKELGVLDEVMDRPFHWAMNDYGDVEREIAAEGLVHELLPPMQEAAKNNKWTGEKWWKRDSQKVR